VGTVNAHESSGSQTLAPTPFPSPKGEGLTVVAIRLAGLTGALLGWRPSEFWNATPAELAAILAALTPDTGNPADHDLITQLKEQFPDG
jgi:Phage tail assembly chaperone protein, TAC